MSGPEPEPATRDAVERALASGGAGVPFKATLERLLLDLEESRADALMLLLKESRGAWALLLRRDAGRALVLGNALSGTILALTVLGWRVVVAERSLTRLALAAARDSEAAPGRVQHIACGADERLPFTDGSFDLVVQEDGAPGTGTGWGYGADELARVARGERVLVADNRLAYKRSTGRRGRFHVPSPLEWVRNALRPARGERSLAGYRRLLGGNVRPFALYPHAREFSHVVALDAPTPRLTIGPKERNNRAKLLAQRVGLFPWLTPSFALIADGPGKQGAPRLERVLDALAERVGEARSDLDVLVATRSNTAVVLTGEADRPGGWALHIALSPTKQKLVTTHARFLRDLPGRFPGVPLPALLFEGELEGVRLVAERRLGGWSAPQITGDLEATRRLFLDASRHLAALVLGAPRALTPEEFERLVVRRFERVRELCAVDATARAIGLHTERLREVLVGRVLPRVVYHADLRAKHVQITPDGRVLGLLDWGASEDEFLPYVDLLHLVVHQRKQEEQGSPARAWQALRERSLRPHELEALEDHGRRLGLDEGYRRAIEEAYPIFVAGMAERNWDYSRPRWVHQQYGL